MELKNRTDENHASDAKEPKTIFYSLVLFAGLFFLLISTISNAETELKNSLDTAEMKLIAETNLSFSECIQKNAAGELNSNTDIREIAAQAVNSCVSVLDKLSAELDEHGINPDFYNGTIEQIKNRAIRRLLPLLMMERSNQSN